MRVQFSEEARAVYLDALDRLHSVNPLAMASLHERVNQSMLRIGRFPLSGNAVPEFRNLPTREFIVEPYRFFYVIEAKKKRVLIVGVWHGAQQAVEPRLPAP